MHLLKILVLPILILLPIPILADSTKKTEQSIDLDLGLSVSKSFLGASYNYGRNQFNLGLRGFAYSARDGWFWQPGIAYNRYFTENGFFASIGYAPTYYSQDVYALDFDTTTHARIYTFEESSGWKAGLLFTGLGKSWQFRHWGLHIDGGAITEADQDFAQTWGYYLGGAASYRFRLN